MGRTVLRGAAHTRCKALSHLCPVHFQPTILKNMLDRQLHMLPKSIAARLQAQILVTNHTFQQHTMLVACHTSLVMVIKYRRTIQIHTQLHCLTKRLHIHLLYLLGLMSNRMAVGYHSRLPAGTQILTGTHHARKCLAHLLMLPHTLLQRLLLLHSHRVVMRFLPRFNPLRPYDRLTHLPHSLHILSTSLADSRPSINYHLYPTILELMSMSIMLPQFDSRHTPGPHRELRSHHHRHLYLLSIHPSVPIQQANILRLDRFLVLQPPTKLTRIISALMLGQSRKVMTNSLATTIS